MHATVDEIAANRDPKGLYKKALAGEIKVSPGVDPDAPYEVPEQPEIRVDTLSPEPRGVVAHVLSRLQELGRIDDDTVLVTGERAHSGMTDLRVSRRHGRQGALTSSRGHSVWCKISSEQRSSFLNERKWHGRSDCDRVRRHHHRGTSDGRGAGPAVGPDHPGRRRGGDRPRRRRPFHTHTNQHAVGAGATWGMFWGFLFGILFFVPFFGMAFGAPIRRADGQDRKGWVDKAFQDQVRAKL